MPRTLDHIKKPILTELTAFEKHFREAMKSKVPLLDKIMYYIVQRKGKQIRPMFVFLAAKICGEINDSSFRAASFIELLHTATLVHDDVVDDSHMRRGFFSINALWKNKIAVLVGDYLLMRGFLMGVEHDEFELLRIVSTAVKAMSEGELLQIEKARKLDIEEDIYYDIIKRKTASLISAACTAGATSVTKDKQRISDMSRLGEAVGIAFQIKDDLLDYGDDDIGKPRAIDIKEKKMTLPLIHVLQKASRADKRRLIRTIKNHNTDKKRVGELLRYVRDHGGLEYAQQSMANYQQTALDILENFEASESRDAMQQLIAFVIDRKK